MKSVVFTACEDEYMNICPPSIIELATPLEMVEAQGGNIRNLSSGPMSTSGTRLAWHAIYFVRKRHAIYFVLQYFCLEEFQLKISAEKQYEVAGFRFSLA